VKKNLDAKDSDILDEFFGSRISNFDVDKLGKNLLFEKLENLYTKFLVTLQDDIKINKRPKVLLDSIIFISLHFNNEENSIAATFLKSAFEVLRNAKVSWKPITTDEERVKVARVEYINRYSYLVDRNDTDFVTPYNLLIISYFDLYDELIDILEEDIDENKYPSVTADFIVKMIFQNPPFPGLYRKSTISGNDLMSLYQSLNHKMERRILTTLVHNIHSDLHMKYENCPWCNFLGKSYHAFITWLIGNGLSHLDSI
ncbi:hypothetical protein Anas_09044, partial [Armadillidium nasatum]